MDSEPSPWAVTGLYVAAVLVGLYPLIDLLLGAWPFELGEALWRYGFLGVASGGSLPVWILSAGLLVGLAHLHGDPRALRVVALVCLVLAAGTVPAMGVFAWDLIEVSSLAQPEQALAFRIRGGIVELKYLGAFIAYLILGLGSLRTRSRLLRRAAGRRR